MNSLYCICHLATYKRLRQGQEAAIDTPEDIHDLIPLREPTFYILLSLARGPQHGYAIMKDVEYMSEARVALSTSTLYTALHRLLEQGLIQREADPEPQEGGRERKVYRLTAAGHRLLSAEVERLESLVVAARGRIAGESA